MPAPPTDLTPEERAECPSAGLLRRLGAMVYDALLVLALALTTTGLANLFAERPVIPEGTETVSLDGMQTVSGPLLSGALFLQTFAFFAFFWIVHGRTLGMQAWRMRAIDLHGHRMSLGQAMRRFIVAIPSLLLLGAGYFAQLLDPAGRSWPDRASGTRTIVMPSDR